MKYFNTDETMKTPQEKAWDEAKLSPNLDYEHGADEGLRRILDIAVRETKKEVIIWLDEEISYLEDHVKRANEGIPTNIERIESWIYQTERIKKHFKEAKR